MLQSPSCTHCARLSLVVASGGFPPAMVPGCLFAVDSLIAEHRLKNMQASVVQAHGLSCPLSQGILFPGQEIKPMSPAFIDR